MAPCRGWERGPPRLLPKRQSTPDRQEVKGQGGRGLKDHLTKVLQSDGPQVEFDSQVLFGLLTVFKIRRFHIKVWISESLEILEDRKLQGPLMQGDN